MDRGATTESQELIRLDALLRDQARVPAACYLAKLAAGHSRRTMEQSLRVIAEEFSRGVCDAQTFPWDQLRYEHTQAIRAKLAERYAPATANKMLAALRGVLKECWRLGKLNVEELHRACDIEPIRGSRQPKGRALTKNELHLLTLHTTTIRDRLLIEFMVVTGLRRAEVAAVTWDDLCTGKLRVRGKGNKERWVPVPARTLVALRGMLDGNDSIHKRLFPLSPGRIWTILREASADAGIETVTPHDLRRTYATRLLSSGVDLATVQRLMGHANPKTTAGYDRRDADTAAEAVERVFGFSAG
jgi:integrase